MTSSEWIGAVTAVLTLLFFIATVALAWKTHEMAVATRQSVENAFRPAIVFSLTSSIDDGIRAHMIQVINFRVHARNVGVGPALEMTARLLGGSLSLELREETGSPTPTCATPGEAVTYWLRSELTRASDVEAILDRAKEGAELRLRVYYRDISGRSWISEAQLLAQEEKVIGAPLASVGPIRFIEGAAG